MFLFFLTRYFLLTFLNCFHFIHVYFNKTKRSSYLIFRVFPKAYSRAFHSRFSTIFLFCFLGQDFTIHFFELFSLDSCVFQQDEETSYLVFPKSYLELSLHDFPLFSSCQIAFSLRVVNKIHMNPVKRVQKS